MLRNKKSTILLCGRFLQALIMLVSMRTITTLLSSTEMGNYYVLQSIFNYAGLILINPVGMFINRKLFEWRQLGCLGLLAKKYNYYLFVVSLLTCLVAVGIRVLGGVGSSISLFGIMLIVPIFIYVNNWNSTIVPTLNMFDYSMAFVIFTNASLGLGLFSSIAIVHFGMKSALGWITGQILGMLIITIVALFYFINKEKSLGMVKQRDSGSYKIEYTTLMRFSIPLAFATAGIWLQQQSYRLVVERMLGGAVLAQLSVGFAVASSISAAIESVGTQMVGPKFYSRISTNSQTERQKAWNEYASFLLPLYMVTTAYIVGLSRQLLVVLTSAAYHNSYRFVIWGAFIELLRVVNNVISNAAHSEYRTDRLILPYLAGGCCVIVGSILSIKILRSVEMIPLVITISGIVVMFLIIFSVRKVSPLSVDLMKIARAVLLSLPMIIFGIIFRGTSTLIPSIALCGVAGIYYLWIFQHLASKNIKLRKD